MSVERLIQYAGLSGEVCLGALGEDLETVIQLECADGLFGLARIALKEGISLEKTAGRLVTSDTYQYSALEASGRVLSPVSHPDPAHCLISGTGLTHNASAEGRNKMHQQQAETETDSLRMYRMGVEGGRPPVGGIGAEPEWFYKGDGSIIARPGAPLYSPGFALDGGEEPELAGVYIIDEKGAPRRLGYCFGNEFSDHVTEKRNYLSLAHSKLRMCALGPELYIGDLPHDLSGEVCIRRGDQLIWSSAFLTGEANMCHSMGNLEHHHFKYQQFRRPGDIHIHFFGTATLSFAEGVTTEPGDWFEIKLPPFSKPLRNQLLQTDDVSVVEVQPL